MFNVIYTAFMCTSSSTVNVSLAGGIVSHIPHSFDGNHRNHTSGDV